MASQADISAERLPPHNGPWYHGSAERLEVLKTGGSASPILEIAAAFSHRPPEVGFETRHCGDVYSVIVRHSGKLPGYLYRVRVDDPARDLRPHPKAGQPIGWEMLTTRPLALEFVRELPLAEEYRGSYSLPGLVRNDDDDEDGCGH